MLPAAALSQSPQVQARLPSSSPSPQPPPGLDPGAQSGSARSGAPSPPPHPRPDPGAQSGSAASHTNTRKLPKPPTLSVHLTARPPGPQVLQQVAYGYHPLTNAPSTPGLAPAQQGRRGRQAARSLGKRVRPRAPCLGLLQPGPLHRRAPGPPTEASLSSASTVTRSWAVSPLPARPGPGPPFSLGLTVAQMTCELSPA